MQMDMVTRNKANGHSQDKKSIISQLVAELQISGEIERYQSYCCHWVISCRKMTVIFEREEGEYMHMDKVERIMANGHSTAEK